MKVATDRRVRPYFAKTFPWIKYAVGFRSEFASIIFVRFELHSILRETKRKWIVGITNGLYGTRGMAHLHLLENEIASVDTSENAILQLFSDESFHSTDECGM